MVLKRCFYILIAAWLINVLVCFHPTNFYESNGVLWPKSSGYHSADNTLLGLICSRFDKKQERKQEQRKISYRKRFINSRSFELDMQVPLVSLWNTRPLFATFTIDPFASLQKQHFLPSHYNFLFRLSPF